MNKICNTITRQVNAKNTRYYLDSGKKMTTLLCVFDRKRLTLALTNNSSLDQVDVAISKAFCYRYKLE